MRLIFINRFYWPETPATGQLLTDLAERLAAAGAEVAVITSHSGATNLPGRERRNGVDLHRIRGTRWSSARLVGKAVDFATFSLGALARLHRLATRDAIVIALTDPPLLGIGASWIARWRGARTIHWIQDIYPELAIALAGQGWLRALRPLRNRAWRQADACVTLGEDMTTVLADAGVDPARRAVIPNWAPAGVTPPPAAESEKLRAAWGLEGKFIVAYSGNLGRVHDLAPVLAAAEALRDEPEMAFLFVGGGPQRAALEAEARRRQLGNVSFRDAQPRDQLAASLAAAEVHLVTLRPGCERLVFPSKLYGIAAVGRPVVFIGPPGCELAQLVAQQDLGAAVDRDDVPQIVAVLRALQRNPAQRARHREAALRFATDHDVSSAVRRWRTLLDGLHACGTPRAAVKTLSA
jgi:glycosyltransferase involved in cell wall biosynthesis